MTFRQAPCRLTLAAIISFVISATFAVDLLAEDWPAWRGPRGNSTSLETGLSAVWTAQSGILWKTELPEWGTSTPAIWGDAIFATTHADDKLLAIKLDRRTGQIEWQQQVGQAAAARTGPKREKQKFHQLHNLASPSPVTDGETVVVHFGNGDLAAYDYAGTLLWKRNLQTDYGTYTIWWGHANSPVIYGDLVISVCMQDSLADLDGKQADSYLVAHELKTGKERWKSARMTGAKSEEGDAYTTPILIDAAGEEQLIVMGANQLDAYNPASGEQLWFLPDLVGGRTVTGPTFAGGLIYVTRGMRGPLLAIKPGGRGRQPNSNIVWRHEKGTPDTPCPVVWNERVYTVTDDGIARAFDALRGRLLWTHRLKGDYKASPLAAEGRVYFLNTAGLCTVLAASDRVEKLSENQIDDDTLASPAAASGHLYLRGKKAIYCLGAKAAGE